jgi:glycosyltransferase involved in cell wall biosynthesis
MKLSIITINRNNATGLAKTVQSVISQSFVDFEYIIIDGNSDDGSVDCIKKNAAKITYWVSQPDTGVYNAMNKGIQKACGDYCLFLNSGDWLIENDTLKNVFCEIETLQDAGVYYSDWTRSDNSFIAFPKTIDVNFLIFKNINHQNLIAKRALFIEHGLYNENLKLFSDWEYWLKESWVYKTKFVHINTNIAIYDTHGMTSTDEFVPLGNTERTIICKNVFNELGDLVSDCLAANLQTKVLFDIKNRNGLGLRFIIKCFKTWLLRNKL